MWHAGSACTFAGPLFCSPPLSSYFGSKQVYKVHVPVMSHSVRQCCKATVAVRFAVTDMFYDVPYSVQAEDEACVMQFGVRSQYNWAAYK